VIIARMINPLGQIQRDVQQFVHFLPAYEKTKQLESEFAARPQQIPEQASKPALLVGEITFKNVSYRYFSDADNAASLHGIEDISLTIKPGEFIGITGPSGSGKTTFADLLVGLCPPQTGQIAVGGAVLEGPMLVSWRDKVSYV